jgi:hypothetical protein
MTFSIVTIGLPTLSTGIKNATLSISNFSMAERHSALQNSAWQKDTQHNEIQYDNTQNKGLICDTQHN